MANLTGWETGREQSQGHRVHNSWSLVGLMSGQQKEKDLGKRDGVCHMPFSTA